MNQEQPNTPQSSAGAFSAAGEKPQMSTTEASWHSTMAGKRAAAEAEAQGCSPEAVDAVLAGASVPKTVGRYTLRPASQGTVYTLSNMAKVFDAYVMENEIPSSGDTENPARREMLEIGLSIMVFADARRVSRELEDGKFEDLLEEAEDLIWEMDIDLTAKLARHFSKEMVRIERLSGNSEPETEPGKPVHPAIAAGASNANPTVPPAEVSPSSNG